ncbi:MAG: hypothetical protein QM769_03170 [Pseudoxanthomonas sp.]
MAPPPTLPADASRRAEPPATPAQRSRDNDAAQQNAQLGAQLNTLLTVTQRLEQAAQVNTTGLHELREELGTVRAQLRDLTAKELAAPPPLLTPPPPRAAASPVITTAAVIAAIAALGALAGSALVIREQKQQQNSLAVFATTTQSLGQTVAHLGESMASRPPPPASEHAAGDKAAVPDGGTRSPEAPATADASKPAACPDTSGAAKSRVLLPNLVGLRLVDARAAVAPLQLQLLPTDKKLKEASKIGWQLPNPGAELESDEAVRVSLKPPVQKKKK